MLKYLKKFAVDIFPSVAATVIGAYIVNHYIVTKPGTAAPPAAAVSTTDPKGEGKAEPTPEARRMAARPAESPAEVGNLPAAGVKARGISEKAIMEKTAAERPTVVEKPQEKAQEKAEAKPDTKPDAKSADAPAETASTPAEPRRHQVAPREKEKIRVVLPSPVQPVPSAAAPAQVASAPNAASAPTPALPAENATAPEERRDANDLARAAIERLRSNPDISPRPAEAATVRVPEIARPEIVRPETARVATAPAPALRPLPPPIMVSAPPSGETAAPPRPPYAANVGAIDSQRPTPPAEIPLSRPLDLRAEAAEPSVRDRATAAAEDALSTAKSIFHAVLPK